MYPVRSFKQITKEIINKYNHAPVTIGILIADGQQTAARDYIVNYMDRFDKKSGKYIDFYVPGYCEKKAPDSLSIEERYHPNSNIIWSDINDKPLFYIMRNQTAYQIPIGFFEMHKK